MSGPSTGNGTPSLLGAAGSLCVRRPRPSRRAAAGYSVPVKPRARDVIGALILSAILVALVVWVVVLASPGH